MLPSYIFEINTGLCFIILPYAITFLAPILLVKPLVKRGQSNGNYQMNATIWFFRFISFITDGLLDFADEIVGAYLFMLLIFFDDFKIQWKK